MTDDKLPLPPYFAPQEVGRVWRVPYQQRASEAEDWASRHRIAAAARDRFRVSLVLVDVQNTFCIPDYELYVGGASGTGAVDDNRRLCKFIYRNLHRITEICPTMDTHQAAQIFHGIFLVNDSGEHPPPFSLVSAEDIETGVWRFNADLAPALNIDASEARRYLLHYVRSLQASGKYELTIWPYHAMLGGIGHALVSAVEEAVFVHSIARGSRPDFQIKGDHPLTENYSVLRPEVLEGPDGRPLAGKNERFIQKLLNFDAVIIAGQAKSHCVAWTIADLLDEIVAADRSLARNVYLLDDCTSPVVIPGVIDYTRPAEEAFERFAESGMHVVRSTDPMIDWPGIAPA
jgi:nicotinamidase-related amidase